MLIIEMFRWWYGAGWGIFLRNLSTRFRNIADFFSIGLLVKTLFNPFRQISAGTPNTENLSIRWHAFLDRLFSRIIGSIVRIFLIILGVAALILTLVVSVASVVVWLTAPALPFLGLALTISGVTL